jgi:hypothetical protein
VNVQSAFIELSVNIQSTFSEHLLSVSEELLPFCAALHFTSQRLYPPLGLQFSEHSVNISVNIQWTFSEHSVDIQEIFIEHSVNIQSPTDQALAVAAAVAEQQAVAQAAAIEVEAQAAIKAAALAEVTDTSQPSQMQRISKKIIPILFTRLSFLQFFFFFF